MEKLIKKSIVGLEPYKADNLGNIYGLKGQKLKPYGRGKNRAYLGVDIGEKTYSVNRLVAYAFGLIDSLEFNGIMIDHINEIKSDNRVVNLQPLTNSQNIRKSKGGDMSLPKGVSYIKKSKRYRFTVYTDKRYPKGKGIKSSKSLEEILEFVKNYNG